ncbi:anti sigma factor C-terminal domain-containing protein [Brevibacillus laterosporus]|uniref:anti sigma factor C-terminal domain-containing protein n=1 Tax=Brevibacillus laterosporus TaxID=1465 RepID=UPI0018CD0137|nr:anti sigma factor C-terminal domain-containing protein [Brevibacillus laterosporus]MBG9787388.1 hypothetical protein [Brevibacillus laterosporus]
MNPDQFDLNQDHQTIRKALQKAKRRNLLRNILISFVISVLVLISFIFASKQIMDYHFYHVREDIETFGEITRPNVEFISFPTRSEGLLQNESVLYTYKNIEGRPIKWEEELYVYSLWGTYTKMSTNLKFWSNGNQNKTKLAYNLHTFQRELLFYLPFITTYETYMNHLEELDELQNGAAELAISFDKPYTVQQIHSMLPEGVHPQWYWVDTYDDKPGLMPRTRSYNVTNEKGQVIGTETATELIKDPYPSYLVYGFKNKSDSASEQDFIESLEKGMKLNGKHQLEYQRIFNFLRGQKEKPDAEDVKIFGVVVTGSKEHLKHLKGVPYARAIVLGASG